ncbi:hypothetical protein ACEPAG_2472 [Sanghuangporus baumii]
MVATRPLRGSRLSSFYPPIPDEKPSLSDFDSAFQLQEYISILIRQNPHDVETIVAPPGRVKKGDQDEKDKSDVDARNDGVDEACWIYEQIRRLAQDLTCPLITSLQQECTRTSCPEMKAGEWLYLCVAHGNDGAMEQCCAIDYIIHTLDSATALLNSPRAFPSRISIPQPSIRHFSSLARRLGRIFSHAYFHHREVFESSEAENSLYARFLALTARFDLVPADFLVIPARVPNPDTSSNSAGDVSPPRLLGASLHPQQQIRGEKDKEKSGGGIMESPRKGGRNRTDTMVFSDAEAFSEALRGQAGSPTSFNLGKDVPSTSPPKSLGFDSSGIPHVDTLQVLAQSSETCRPQPYSPEKDEKDGEKDEEKETEKEKETKPYTLTFSASGTMKTALPPGVSPSSSAAGGLGLAPSPLQVPSNASNINTGEWQQSGHNSSSVISQLSGLGSFRGPLSGPGYTGSGPFEEQEGIEYKEGDDAISSQFAPDPRPEEIYFGGRYEEILPLRKGVLQGRISDVELKETDKEEGAAIDELSGESKAAESGDAKREEEGEFVVIGEESEPNQAEKNKPPHSELVSTDEGDTTHASDLATEAVPKEVAEEDKADESSPSGSEPVEDRPSISIDADKSAETKGDDSSGEAQDPDASSETDLADVEKALHE